MNCPGCQIPSGSLHPIISTLPTCSGRGGLLQTPSVKEFSCWGLGRGPSLPLPCLQRYGKPWLSAKGSKPAWGNIEAHTTVGLGGSMRTSHTHLYWQPLTPLLGILHLPNVKVPADDPNEESTPERFWPLMQKFIEHSISALMNTKPALANWRQKDN